MANKIIHKHSSVITDGKAKLPSVEQLEYGELAVNYASGVETISIKNSDNEIVEFKSNNYVEGIIKELEQVVEDNGFITAASLNELNEKLKKLEESGSGSVIEEIDGIKKEIENNEYVIATALTDLDDRLYLLGETVDENELVTAAALTQLNEKVKSLEDGNVSGLDEKLVAMEQMIENNSLVAAAALTNLDERTTDLSLRITDFDYKADLLDNRFADYINEVNERLDSNTITKGQSLVDAVSGYVLDTPKVIINLTKYAGQTPENLNLKEGDVITLNCTSNKVEAPSQAFPFHINLGGKHVICKMSDGEYMTKYNYGALTGHHTFMYMNKCFVLVSDDMDNFVQINHGTNDTSFALTPNRFHIWGAVPTLNLSLKTPTPGVANEYVFQFTSIEEGTNLSLPYNVQWVNDTPPTITGGMTYQISIVNGLATAFEYAKKEPNTNEIWYTTSDGVTLEPYFENANIISNIYKNGMGVLTFDTDITSLEDNVFEYQTTLTSITIPNSVTHIGAAFPDCYGLTEITIPDSVTEIGTSAFAYCSNLVSVNLGNGVTSIGKSAFYDCISLPSITIPESVTTIGENAFYDCKKLTSVYCKPTTPPAGNSSMFSGNASGRKIYVPMASVNAYKSAEYWSDYADAIETSSLNNVIYYTTSNDDIVTPYSTSVFGANILSNTYENGVGIITFDADVTSIGDYAFYYCDYLTSITIPDSVTSIGNNAFWGCNGLTSIIIPEGVTSIGDEAFYYCSSLPSITIPDSVTSIGREAFYSCGELTEFNGMLATEDKRCLVVDGKLSGFAPAGLTSYNIPEGVTSIGDSTFALCESLTEITIPEGVTSIGRDAFFFCTSLASINIPEGVTTIGDRAFSDCKSLTSITIPEGVTSIGERPFQNCTSLASITIPEGITSISEEAFENCESLTSITIPDSVTSIGSWAFNKCKSLTSVDLGNGVTSIGSLAFHSCEKLAEFNGMLATEDKRCIVIDGKLIAFAPAGLTSYNIPEGVTEIDKRVFDGCSNLTSITIPEGVTTIGEYAFSDCTSLTSINIPDSVTTIGVRAFYGCTSLTSINIPDSVTEISSGAFYNCTKLNSVTIPYSVTKFSESLFTGCKSLKTITIPNSVTSIGSYVFYNCSALTSINIPESVTSIGSYVFYNCSALTSINIPESVTSIGDWAFYNCNNLTSIAIPNSVTSIGGGAFKNCTSLTEITIPDSVTTIGEDVFYNCKKLTSVYCKPTTPPAGNSNMFSTNASGRKIYVPMASVDAYKAAQYWSNYSSAIEGYNF